MAHAWRGGSRRRGDLLSGTSPAAWLGCSPCQLLVGVLEIVKSAAEVLSAHEYAVERIFEFSLMAKDLISTDANMMLDG